ATWAGPCNMYAMATGPVSGCICRPCPHRKGSGMADGKTILLVEDDPAIALIIRETLAPECSHLAAVTSVAERNAWLAENRADLIITDVVLPDGDGIDSLPGAGVDPATPVIVLSAQNTLDTAVRATGIGSYDYLPKPFDLDELIAS